MFRLEDFKENSLLLYTTAGVLGMLLFLYFNGTIIIRSPLSSSSLIQAQFEQRTVRKKNIVIYYWQHERWYGEEVEILWPETSSEQLKHLVKAWLNVLEEEEAAFEKVNLQSALVNKTTGYLSFDRSPFDKEKAVSTKVMLIEALLKTVLKSGIKVQELYFMIHHQPMEDSHLYFSQPWQTIGYLLESQVETS